MGFWASDKLNTCLKVPLQSIFLVDDIFCIAFYESYLSEVKANLGICWC
jgi:hypothetical protein